MAVISETVMMKWSPKNKKHYEDKGYIWTKQGDTFEVKVSDLTPYSQVIVVVECDLCKNRNNVLWCNYGKAINNKGRYICLKCSGVANAQKMTDKRREQNGNFKIWCMENNRQDILNRWDYELNGCSPDSVNYSTNIKRWFKCPCGKHKSELKSINSFTNGHEGTMKCAGCNSFGQYLIDTYGENTINIYWGEKNDNNPWELAKKSMKKIWIKCADTSYHGEYQTTCTAFTTGYRCPYCTGKSGKVHKLDSLGQYIIDTYGKDFLEKIWSSKNNKTYYEYTPTSHKKVMWKCENNQHEDYMREVNNSNAYSFRCPQCIFETDNSNIQKTVRQYLIDNNYEVLHEYNCSFMPKHPKTNYLLPYDNDVIIRIGDKERHLLIEVHGIQHYQLLREGHIWLRGVQPQEYLHNRKIIDRYKRIKAINNKYYYLELSYLEIEHGDYKEKINNKINEIVKENAY